MSEHINGIKYFLVIVRVGLVQNGEQVRTIGRGTITVIYEIFCNERHVCVAF